MPRISETKYNTDLYAKDIAAGVIGTHPALIDNNDGTFDIAGCEVLLYSNSEKSGELKKFTILADTGVVTTADVTNYLVVDYNSGNPIYQVITNLSLINESDVIPVTTIYNDNNTELHLIEWDSLGDGLSNPLNGKSRF